MKKQSEHFDSEEPMALTIDHDVPKSSIDGQSTKFLMCIKRRVLGQVHKSVTCKNRVIISQMIAKLGPVYKQNPQMKGFD